LFAQKGLLTPSILENWTSLSSASITNDGRYAFYTINTAPPGKDTFILKSTTNDWEERFTAVSNPTFACNDQLCILQQGKDTIALINLGSKNIAYRNSNSFQVGSSERGNWLCYIDTGSGDLVMLNLIENQKRAYKKVLNYLLAKNGSTLLIEHGNSKDMKSISWVDNRDGSETVIWRGTSVISNYIFNSDFDQIAFMTNDGNSYSIWSYRVGEENAHLVADNKTLGIIPSTVISNNYLKFSKDGSKLFFRLKLRSSDIVTSGIAMVDVWSYNDKLIQAQQLRHTKDGIYYNVAVRLESVKQGIIFLSRENEEAIQFSYGDEDYALVRTVPCAEEEAHWKIGCKSKLYLLNINSGNRVLVHDSLLHSYTSCISPKNQFVIFYNYDEQNYYSYNVSTGNTINITKAIPVPIYAEEFAKGGKPLPYGGTNNWFSNDKALIIYDRYDIWRVDPTGFTKPVCLTNGYGRKNQICFRLTYDGLISGNSILLNSFDYNSKYNGLFKIELGSIANPKKLIDGPFIYSWPSIAGAPPIKAKNAEAYIFSRQNSSESPNYYFTKDFHTIIGLSQVYPEQNFNWLTSELHHFINYDGKINSGILYKPENFDSTKKYPLLVTFYEERSNELHKYLSPRLTEATINIPFFVSNGYLVFVPDIKFLIGQTGQSIYNSVVAGVDYLSSKSYVNKSKIGILGHSFGGYEVNFLITKTKLFAAAAEASGISDLISGSNNIQDDGFSKQFQGDIGQYRLGTTLWQRPDLYIKNSPIFYANKVATPLLMMNNKGDRTVTFEQGLEFFLALRRLNKKVWMLQYDNGEHQLYRGNDPLDYTNRLSQFFDHYLKDAPAPVWMTQGIPARLKGVISGYDLDPSNSCSKDCKVCKMWNEKWKKDSVKTMSEIREKIKSENWIGGGE
jgi:hypothetical protein